MTYELRCHDLLTGADALAQVRSSLNPYLLPSYLNAEDCMREGDLTIFSSPDRRIVQPLFIQWHELHGVRVGHATSPYGYPGVTFFRGTSVDQVIEFRRRVHDELRARGVLTEFVRHWPYGGSHHSNVETLRQTDTVVPSGCVVRVPTSNATEYWDNSESRSRTKVRKSWRSGLAGGVQRPSITDLDAFYTLYTESMRRMGASARYLFSREYFRRLHRPEWGALWMAKVDHADHEYVGAALFYVMGSTVHCHLTADTPFGRQRSVNNYLYDMIIRWGVSRGLDWISLGGGPSAEHPLFRFKAGFGGQVQTFYTARTVLDVGSYREILSRVNADDSTAFFPAYLAASE